MFYTYLWLREDGTPYYVGKGTGKRAYVRHRIGKAPIGRITFYIAVDEKDAVETEKLLIWYYGRKDLGLGCLRNFTNGGDGVSGYKHTEHSKRKNSEWHKGRRLSEAHRKACSLALTGHKVTEETRQKIRASNTGHGFAEETLQKMSEAKKGKRLSKEHIRSLVAAIKRRPPISEETRIKQSAAAKVREQVRRNKLVSTFNLTHEQDFLIKTLVNIVKRRESARAWSRANPEKVKERNARRYKK